MIFCIKTPIYAYLLYIKKIVKVKYQIGEHKAPIDIFPISQVIRCRALISNGDANRWASHKKGGNISQVSRKNSGPKEERGVEERYLL